MRKRLETRVHLGRRRLHLIVGIGALFLVACSFLEPNWMHFSSFMDIIQFEQVPIEELKNISHEFSGNQTTPSEMMEPAKYNIHASLVLTYCSGDLQWLKNYTHGFHFDYTFVAIKCGIEPDRDALPEGAELVRLPNVGGCDHTVAFWMSEVLPTLPRRGTPGVVDDEVVLFLKDTMSERDQTVQQDFNTLLDLALSDQAFGCLYVYNLDTPWKFYQYTDIVRMFSVKSYARVRQGIVNEDHIPFESPYANVGEWQDAMNIEMPQPMVPACYGGTFTVKRSRIEQVPIQILKNITHSLSRGNNIAETHFAERTWAGLLMDKEYIKNATIGLTGQTSPSNMETPRGEHVVTTNQVPLNRTIDSTMKATNKTVHASLVMTYCSGDLQWLQNYTHGFEFDYTYVATKCGIEPDREALPAGAELVPFPNVGGCDHTMAYWMSEVLPTLPRRGTPGEDDEVVFFVKDTINHRVKTVEQDFETLLELALSDQGFGCLYVYDLDSPWKFYQSTNKVRKFWAKKYVRESSREGVFEDDNVPVASPYANVGEWQDAMNIEMPRPMVPACYGGIFMVKRSRIEQVPIQILKNITQSLSRGNNIEEGHFAERTWAALLMDKEYIKKATIGMAK